MQEPPERVHQQSNGARIRVAQVEVQAPEPEPIPTVGMGPPSLQSGRHASAIARERAAATVVVAGEEGSWGMAAGFGVMAAVLSSLIYNMVVLLTWIDFKLLATVSGTAIGAAVRVAKPPGGDPPRRALALFLTYLCIGSVYVPWWYDELAHPEKYAWMEQEYVNAFDLLEEDNGQAWDPAFDPVEKPTGPVELASMDAPAPVESTFNAEALLTAIGRAMVLPAWLLISTDVLGLIWLAAALVQAWRFSSDKW